MFKLGGQHGSHDLAARQDLVSLLRAIAGRVARVAEEMDHCLTRCKVLRLQKIAGPDACSGRTIRATMRQEWAVAFVLSFQCRSLRQYARRAEVAAVTRIDGVIPKNCIGV